LFFIMSDVALTYASDARPSDVLPAALRRLIRLGVPLAAAVLVAGILFAGLPDAHDLAAQYAGLERAASDAPNLPAPRKVGVIAIAHEIALEGMLAGFDGISRLLAWATS
jgi:hypothetical protein